MKGKSTCNKPEEKDLTSINLTIQILLTTSGVDGRIMKPQSACALYSSLIILHKLLLKLSHEIIYTCYLMLLDTVDEVTVLQVKSKYVELLPHNLQLGPLPWPNLYHRGALRVAFFLKVCLWIFRLRSRISFEFDLFNMQNS